MKIRELLFEFEDLPGFPAIIREGMTDYLRYVITWLNFYEPITPVILEGLQKTGTTQMVDLCSGGGGAIEQIITNVQSKSNQPLHIVLTDKFPNNSAYQLLFEKSKGKITYERYPVDAAYVPDHLPGFRTIFSGFHHFDPPFATAVLKNAVDAKSGIAIFDGGDKNVLLTLALTLLQPLAFFFFTPFFKPFTISRLLFTYIIPVIPLCTMWDGIVSMMRLYKPGELLSMAKAIDNDNYYWRAGKVKNRLGMHVAYLLGYPI